jgi:rRNA maturation endonuclease Nob1
MNIFLKRCKECGKGFDIGTNFDICPECRRKKRKYNFLITEDMINEQRRLGI